MVSHVAHGETLVPKNSCLKDRYRCLRGAVDQGVMGPSDNMLGYVNCFYLLLSVLSVSISFICFYLFLPVSICFYLFPSVSICFYLFLHVSICFICFDAKKLKVTPLTIWFRAEIFYSPGPKIYIVEFDLVANDLLQNEYKRSSCIYIQLVIMYKRICQILI